MISTYHLFQFTMLQCTECHDFNLPFWISICLEIPDFELPWDNYRSRFNFTVPDCLLVWIYYYVRFLVRSWQPQSQLTRQVWASWAPSPGPSPFHRVLWISISHVLNYNHKTDNVLVNWNCQTVNWNHMAFWEGKLKLWTVHWNQIAFLTWSREKVHRRREYKS